MVLLQDLLPLLLQALLVEVQLPLLRLPAQVQAREQLPALPGKAVQGL